MTKALLSNGIIQNLVKRHLSTACPDHIFFLCFSKMHIFLTIFFFVFVFVTMGPYALKFSNDISSESAHQIHSPKFMCTHTEGLYQSCYKYCEFQIWIFALFSFSLTWGHMGVKVSKDISTEIKTRLTPPNSLHVYS